MGYIGQRLNDSAALPGEIIAVPPAATATIRDDLPIDAEIAMVLHQNAAHLAAEAVRPLAWWEGNLALPQTDSWVGLVDAARPDGAETQTAEWEIAWNSASARRAGPFPAVQDRAGARDEPLLRRIAVEVELNASITALYLALTAGFHPVPPYLGYVAFTKSTSTVAGVNTFTLDATAALGGGERVACRPSVAGRTQYSAPRWYWLWVGWKSTNAADRLLSFSAYETR